MRIALIFPSYTHKIFSENLITVDEEFCLAPPIILAYVAAILEKHGHKVIIIDARALNMSKEEALRQISNFKPDILGFRAETYHFHDALQWMGYFKAHLRIPIFTGGINMTLYPRETLSHDVIDYGIIGEAIESLPQFISALEKGDSIAEIDGIGYKDREGNIITKPARNKFVDFDSYPFPARHLLPNDKYHSFISQRKNFTIMLTSTGCPFKCKFCAIPNFYRIRSPKSVIAEIEMCYRDFNIREIDFFDAILFMPRARVLEIFRQLKRRKLDLEWSCRSRVDVVDDEILKEAAAAGCRQIYYGIESTDQIVLDRIHKNITLDKISQAIKLSRKYKIRTMGFFMIGNAGDTTQNIRRTIEFAKKLDLDFIQVCRTIAKPGTDLDREMIEFTGYDFWREHVLGNKIMERLPTPWTSLTEEEKVALTREFYLKFYFRPKIIWRRLIQLKSLSELKRYLRVGLKMLIRKTQIYSSVLTDTTEAQKYLNQSSYFLSEARKKQVAVVIPTYNERGNIDKIVPFIIKVLPEAYIIIVDDDSPDGTGAIADRLSENNSKIYVIHRKGERGLGLAYKDGFKFVLANLSVDYIFEMDADFSHNPQYLPLFLHYARFYDLVTGSRFLKRVSIKNRSLWRNIISKITKWFVNILIGMDVTDVTTGFKCFQQHILEKIDIDKIESKGYAFQIEGSYYVKKIGGRIKEIPILFMERSIGKSKMSWRIMLEGVCLIWKIFLRRLFEKVTLKN
jgi:radical SAM superfamily enzyme YgiQ (UPF0313 family)